MVSHTLLSGCYEEQQHDTWVWRFINLIYTLEFVVLENLFLGLSGFYFLCSLGLLLFGVKSVRRSLAKLRCENGSKEEPLPPG